jgi:hypothetical protein
MKRRDFLGHTDRVSIQSTPYCLLFEFLQPSEDVADKIPASAIGVIWKRCYQIDLPQEGWRIDHAGHWWRLIEIEQRLANKGSRDQDYLPVRVCKYLEPKA